MTSWIFMVTDISREMIDKRIEEIAQYAIEANTRSVAFNKLFN